MREMRRRRKELVANGEPIEPPKPRTLTIRRRRPRERSPSPFDRRMYPSLSPNRPVQSSEPGERKSPEVDDEEIFSVTTLNMIEFIGQDDDSQDHTPYNQLLKEIIATYKSVPESHQIEAAARCLKVLRSYIPESEEP